MKKLEKRYILEENVEVIYLKIAEEIIFMAKKVDGNTYCKHNKENKTEIGEIKFKLLIIH